MKQKNKWLDRLTVFLFVIGVIGVCVSLIIGAFKANPLVGCLVVFAEFVIISCMLHNFKGS